MMDRQTFRKNARSTKKEVQDNLKQANKVKVVLSVLKLLLLLTIVITVPLYIYFFHGDFLNQFRSFDDIILFLQNYKVESIFIYIGIQVLQIIISVIPGQAFQFAAGYLYTFFPGLLFSIIGAAIGTCISFYLAKFLGKDAVHLFFGEERTAYLIKHLNSKRAYTIVFLLYLIPGLPKDVVSYVAGISEMKFKPFLVLSLLGRIPGMSGSLLIGALYFKGYYAAMVIVAVLAIVTFCVCVICRKKITAYLDRLYDRICQ